MTYNHTAISVTDIAATEAFYKVLGFSRLREWSKPHEALQAVVLKKDNLILELIHHPSNKLNVPPKVVEIKHTGVVVQDITKTLKALRIADHQLLKPITKGVTVKEFAFVSDPSGNVVELLVENE